MSSGVGACVLPGTSQQEKVQSLGPHRAGTQGASGTCGLVAFVTVWESYCNRRAWGPSKDPSNPRLYVMMRIALNGLLDCRPSRAL